MKSVHFLPAAIYLFAVFNLTLLHAQDSIIGPDYKNAPEMHANPDVPKGTLFHFVMESVDSKYYPGLNGPYHRDVYVYVPKQYVSGTAAPLLVVQDGKAYTNRLPVVLDNLIAGSQVPAMVAVMIQSGGGDGRGSERGLEYDTISGKYTEFVENEVLPQVERRCQVKLTRDPNERAAMGRSSGAACAFTMAWFHPDLYRRVLSYSGTFVNQQSPFNPASPDGAWEYHEHLIPQTDAKPLRVWLEVGEHDLGFDQDEASLHNWVMANQRMAAVLKAKGYHYQFIFAKDSGHVDRRVVGETLAAALVWLWDDGR
ncbi:MAG TPA: alpha/beta hydrolase-fold protein [Alphaproteobacteria bacterium]|nr:alpha/beta hydrolase-fold protein [Alphaproteobacteria bacterium]